MKLLHCVALIAVLLALPGPDCRASAEADSEGPPPLDCRSGPLKKTYGNEAWLVYGCNDHRSAVVVSDKGNPAVPFCFILYVKPDDSVRLYGEGTGDKSTTQAAFDELKELTRADVGELVSAAEAIDTAGE